MTRKKLAVLVGIAIAITLTATTATVTFITHPQKPIAAEALTEKYIEPAVQHRLTPAEEAYKHTQEHIEQEHIEHEGYHVSATPLVQRIMPKSKEMDKRAREHKKLEEYMGVHHAGPRVLVQRYVPKSEEMDRRAQEHRKLEEYIGGRPANPVPLATK